MSDKMRWRYGDTNPVVAAVDADTEIEIGDLLLQDVDNAKPACVAHLHLHSDGEPGPSQFKQAFLGVAMQRSRKGDTAPIRVATTGVFEFDCSRDVFELGDLICADVNAAGTALSNQQVRKTIARRVAIGRVAKRQPLPGTRILIDIRSTVMTGGV
jgi:hypothetical protein